MTPSLPTGPGAPDSAQWNLDSGKHRRSQFGPYLIRRLIGRGGLGGTAHWRPRSPSIAARSDATPRPEHLPQLATRILDLAAPLLNRVIPTPASALTALAPDPDKVLSRNFTSADAPQISAQYAIPANA